jgi:glycosyltransferase involved in cell wall biosynthesis
VNILYVALRESLPGSHGGAVHVLEVARQLARRGHQVTVVVKQEAGQGLDQRLEGFEVVRLRLPANYLLFRADKSIGKLVDEVRPDILMERYYNFAGGGIAAAKAANIPSLLEVNAPLVDPSGTTKARLDLLLLGWMRRRALTQANAATRIVTPLAATIPLSISRDKIREIPWGANVELFNPAALDPQRVARLRTRLNQDSRRVVAFLGSFRPWHGVREFVDAARVIAHTRGDILFLMIGSGELLEQMRGSVVRYGLERQIILTGAVPYEQVPYYLAIADVGAAPFNTSVHPPLRVGFYWSPLKIHEYMAMSIPVVTIDVHPLNQIVRDGREGLLYPETEPVKLRSNIEALVDDVTLARRLGEAGRKRAVENFSWQKHAERLEQVLGECLG